MNKNVLIAALLTLLLIACGYTLYSLNSAKPKLTRVTVTGESQTEVPPDNAVVRFSVLTKDKLAVTAQQQNARKTEIVISALKQLTNQTEAEIKTSNYSLDSEQNYAFSGMSKIVGYEARNSITVTTKDLNQVGALIDAATNAGANEVEGINFILREDSPNRGDSLGSSTKQAMAKAEAIADSLGGKIFRVVEAQEGGLNPQPMSTSFDSANAAANSVYKRSVTPVIAGSLTIRSQILLIVEVEPK